MKVNTFFSEFISEFLSFSIIECSFPRPFTRVTSQHPWTSWLFVSLSWMSLSLTLSALLLCGVWGAMATMVIRLPDVTLYGPIPRIHSCATADYPPYG